MPRQVWTIETQTGRRREKPSPRRDCHEIRHWRNASGKILPAQMELAEDDAMPTYEDLKVFTGNAHPQLARDVCSYLGISLGQCEVFKFQNDNTFVRILENVREKDIFIIQPSSAPVDQHLMEMLIMIDAAKRASAGRITAVLPYFPYARSDKKDQPRVPITARLVANMITTAGADRVLTVDLHAGQIQGFFNIPVDELTAVPMLARNFKDRGLPRLVVAATDVGGAKHARDMAHLLDAPIAIVEKARMGNQDRVEALNLIGDVDDCDVLIVEDEVVTGGTIVATLDALKKHGANDMYCSVTHPVLAGNAIELLRDSALKETVVTDTHPVAEEKRFPGLTVLSVAGPAGGGDSPNPQRPFRWRHVLGLTASSAATVGNGFFISGLLGQSDKKGGVQRGEAPAPVLSGAEGPGV